jgi:hypothetical protein
MAATARVPKSEMLRRPTKHPKPVGALRLEDTKPQFKAGGRYAPTSSSVIPEGVGPCQGGFAGGSGCLRACVTGVSCFPGSCHIRGERPGRSRTGRSPAADGGAGGVLEVTGREPDDLAAGEREPGAVRGMRLFRSVPYPVSSGAGSAAGCSHPFGCPGGAGAHGAGPRQGRRSGGVNQAGARAARAAGQTQRRPRAWPLAREAGHAAHWAGVIGGGSWGVWDRARICPSRRP